ncbi:hypothetical protein [Streptomyces zaomyceticus]|uniref:hypothetical protein n=1 Tax=Streptomyces zaomyceticus TaxID=68286 RepID=UPI002E0FEE55|nr:hypothetical protein OG237_18300 [Streptomyces zaomyceticus]
MSYQDDLDISGVTPGTLERTLRSRADAWSYSAETENAVAHLAAGGHLTPEMRMAAGYYANGKKAAAAAGHDITDPDAPKDDAHKLTAAYRAISQPRPNSL